ncbi:FAD-dependent monooxygenase [Nocardia sp. alder85J]|uniref:FAD-dependent monooxygenase n=1 Tax=Nocardia sp. alder85J TaxID=2862949 RepID=UPI001CD6A319|nr:FAD-dependent monooxygenase [Nocardia sp. alder85J]MCX4091386.1 FAD-dependent monooxygenase [Nocardia sp. alder85J]
MDGNRVGIIGGSIAGCAAAIVLRQAGCDVTVFERSSGVLRDRGHGVSLSGETRAELVDADLIDADLPARPLSERSWFVRDGDAPLGRLVWQQPFSGIVHNWGMLWANLRDRVPGTDYRDGVPVNRIESADDGVTVYLDGGEAERFDLVIGADGYRSLVRAAVDPAAEPTSSGYVLWRGGYPITELPQPIPEVLYEQSVTIAFPGGHAMVMIIPGDGGPRVYWAVYHQPAEPLPPEADHLAPADFPGLDTTLSQHFPPYWAEMVDRTRRDTTVIHPVLDIRTSRYTAPRLALLGDAATMTRPHTGSGAVKAVQDALALGRLRREHGDWATVLAEYDAVRRPAGTALVDLGRRIGEAQVISTPPWDSMTPDDFTAWIQSVLSGRRLYLYDNLR